MTAAAPVSQIRPAASPVPLLHMAAAAPAGNALGKATVILGMYVFLMAAPVAEIVIIHLHFNSHIALLGAIFVLGISLMTGRMGRFLSLPMAKPWLALIVMFLAAGATSIYRSLSLKLILGYAALFHVLPFFFCAIAVTTRQVRHLMYWAIAGVLLVLLICWQSGTYSNDFRFYIPDIEALGNPNDLAFGLLFGSTFLLLLAFRKSVLTRLLFLAAFPVTMSYALKTGSRANLLTLVFMSIVIFFLLPRLSKLVFLAAVVIMAGYLSLTVPSATWQRLKLFSSDPLTETAATEELQSAVQSQLARQDLQKRGVQLVIRHPLLGVGPYMFADAVENMVRSMEGHKSGWQGPHNVYLQIAAETGVPSLILFITSILYCMTTNYRSYKLLKGLAEFRLERLQSLCLVLATFDYAFGILFCNMAYYAYLGLLVAFTAANSLAVQNELHQRQMNSPATVGFGSGGKSMPDLSAKHPSFVQPARPHA